jgi:hypothetical protein
MADTQATVRTSAIAGDTTAFKRARAVASDTISNEADRARFVHSIRAILDASLGGGARSPEVDKSY